MFDFFDFVSVIHSRPGFSETPKLEKWYLNSFVHFERKIQTFFYCWNEFLMIANGSHLLLGYKSVLDINLSDSFSFLVRANKKLFG